MFVRSVVIPFIVRACTMRAPTPVMCSTRSFSLPAYSNNNDECSWWTIKNSENDTNKQRRKAMRLKTKRMMKVITNKMSQDWPPCYYCGSSGFVDCDNCMDGCWKCQHTRMLECPFCSGSGKGRYARQEANIKN